MNSFISLYRPSCRLWHSMQSSIPSGMQSSHSGFHFMSYGIVGCSMSILAKSSALIIAMPQTFSIYSGLTRIASASINLNFCFPFHFCSTVRTICPTSSLTTLRYTALTALHPRMTHCISKHPVCCISLRWRFW